ncbi:MAG: hypothetical protein SVN78_10195 [Deferribacterota bacterium]|nr:hypothetical protein [Deferribacterota bacterium]
MKLWKWIGSIIGLYGVVLIILGIYYFINPERVTATAEYNPTFWWGLFMTLFASILFIISHKNENS